jgi:hypothetical protein
VTSLALLIAGIVLVIAGAELVLGGLLGAAARLDLSPFVLTVLFSGFELENLAAGIARAGRSLQDPQAPPRNGDPWFVSSRAWQR